MIDGVWVSYRNIEKFNSFLKRLGISYFSYKSHQHIFKYINRFEG